MKKLALILLVCTYSLSILGIGIKQFYCCGKLKSTDITFVHDAKEKCHKDSDAGGCCETRFNSLKVKDSHVAADAISIPVKYLTYLHLFGPSPGTMALANELMSVANASHAPPLHNSVPIYILHCIYRI